MQAAPWLHQISRLPFCGQLRAQSQHLHLVDGESHAAWLGPHEVEDLLGCYPGAVPGSLQGQPAPIPLNGIDHHLPRPAGQGHSCDLIPIALQQAGSGV